MESGLIASQTDSHFSRLLSTLSQSQSERTTYISYFFHPKDSSIRLRLTVLGIVLDHIERSTERLASVKIGHRRRGHYGSPSSDAPGKQSLAHQTPSFTGAYALFLHTLLAAAPSCHPIATALTMRIDVRLHNSIPESFPIPPAATMLSRERLQTHPAHHRTEPPALVVFV